MSFFNLPWGFFTSIRACRVLVRRGNIRDLAVKLSAEIGVRGDGHRITKVNVRQVFLINIGQHPHGTHIGDREDLRGAGLDDLPWRYQPFHGFAGDGS